MTKKPKEINLSGLYMTIPKTFPNSKKQIWKDRLLDFYKQGLTQNQIATRLNVKPNVVSYQTKKLINQGFLTETVHSSVKIYEVNEANISRFQISLTGGERPPIKLHGMSIEVPILKDTPLPDTAINEGLNNVQRQFKRLPVRGITLTRIVGKIPKIIIHVHPIELKDPKEEYGVFFQASLLAIDYLKSIGMEVDITKIKTRGREMSLSDPVAKQESKEGRYTKVSLGRGVAKILPTDPETPAKSWIDASEGRPEVESNDRLWVGNYLLMPDRVASIAEAQTRLTEYNENLKLHIGVMKDIQKWVHEARTKEKKQTRLIDSLLQRRIGEYV